MTIEHNITTTVPVAGAVCFNASRPASYALAKHGVIPTIRCGARRYVPVAKLAERVGVDLETLRAAIAAYVAKGADGNTATATDAGAGR